MADRPVIDPIPMDKIFEPQHSAEPQHTADPQHSAAQTPPSENAATAGQPPVGVPAAAVPGAGTASPSVPADAGSVPGTANAPGAANTAPVPPAPGVPPMPGVSPVPPVPPAPPAPPASGAQYAPYMYSQPDAGPAPHYAANAPQTPPPYPYAPGSWNYGAPVQPDFISTGSYIGMFLIGMIPLVGLIYLIIQAAGNQWRPNRRNFARGFLAAQVIVIVGLYALLILSLLFMRTGGYNY